MATKRQAKGTVLQLSIASVFTTVALVKKIDYPDDETQFTDGTSLDSTNTEDGVVTGLSTPGMCSADLFYDPLDSVHQALIASRIGRSTEAWKITNPNVGGTLAHACTFSGVIKKFKPSANVGGLLEASCEIKLTTICAFNVAA